MRNKTRIGIYGGTFSPPHLGHYRALDAFIKQERPDKTLVIPTCLPPHKATADGATPTARLTMCRLAFGRLPVCVSDREIVRGGKSYTVLTLEELQASDTVLLFLCGTDMFLSMDTWYRPDKIFALAEIVYVRREVGATDDAVAAALNHKAEYYRKAFGATVRELQCDAFEISSTAIREAVRLNQNTTAFLDPEVRRYIDECQLYRK